jgi:hypothetical protein
MLFQKIKTPLNLLFCLIVLTSCGGSNNISDTVILISTAEQLKNINNGLQKNYKLVNDIDLKNEEWVPIAPYSGTFDGQGFTISNLKITLPYAHVGLFSKNSGDIENLVIKNVDINIEGLIRNNIYAGAIVGYNSGYLNNLKSESGRINIVNSNPYLRETFVGGLVGYTDSMLEIDVDFTNYEDMMIEVKVDPLIDDYEIMKLVHRLISTFLLLMGLDNLSCEWYRKYVLKK